MILKAKKLVLLAAVLSVAAVRAPGAQARWWPPVEVSPGPLQSGPALSFWPDGIGEIAFQDGSRTANTAQLRVKGRFDTPAPVSPVVDGTLRQLLMTSGGGTTLLFENIDHSWSAQVRRPGFQAFDSPQQLAGSPNPSLPSASLSATSQGAAIATTVNPAGFPQVSVLPRNAATFTDPVFLTPSFESIPGRSSLLGTAPAARLWHGAASRRACGSPIRPRAEGSALA